MPNINAYGRLLRVQREQESWRVYDLSGDGKRRPASDIVIPPGLTEEELLVYLDDLLHEYATPGTTCRVISK